MRTERTPGQRAVPRWRRVGAGLALAVAIGIIGCEPVAAPEREKPRAAKFAEPDWEKIPASPAEREKSRAAPAKSYAAPLAKQVELVVFTAKWCPHCEKVPAVLAKLRVEFPAVSIRELDFDAWASQKLKAQCEAKAVPTAFLFADGKIVARPKGIMQYDYAEYALNAELKKLNFPRKR